MRPAISADETTGSSRFQADNEIGSDDLSHDISYHETLECVRDAYERQDIAAPQPASTATAPWVPIATVLQSVSDTAFLIEARRRGYAIAGKVLSGKYHDSGKKKHVRKSQRGNTK